MNVLHKTIQSMWIYLLAIKMDLIFLKAWRRKITSGFYGDETPKLLLFHANNTILAVFQANKQIGGLHDASGCL
ncbi:hypothetical protein BMR22_09020 [Escherichia marmotae]|nr:hypothetical protein BMR22_09020 [Escherichia marmotae]PGF82848.1 hypothetical protein BMR23_13545 [Escherichia marmotae]